MIVSVSISGGTYFKISFVTKCVPVITKTSLFKYTENFTSNNFLGILSQRFCSINDIRKYLEAIPDITNFLVHMQ